MLSSLNDSISALRVSRTPRDAPRLRILLILDVGGLLLDRLRRGEPSPVGVQESFAYGSGNGRYRVFERPHARAFCAWALQTFRVAVWSSARLSNLQPLVDFMFTEEQRARLAFVWGQDKCGTAGTVNSRQGGTKPLFLKELSKVFDAGLGDASTTLLVDDDAYKASRNPAHTAIHPAKWEVASPQSNDDDALAEGGALRTMLARLADAPSVPADGEEWLSVKRTTVGSHPGSPTVALNSQSSHSSPSS